MKEKLDAILKNGLSEIENADNLKALDDVRVKFLGKQGELTAILRNMKEIPAEERKDVGMLANVVRNKIEEALSKKLAVLEEQQLEVEMEKERVDITMRNF